MSSRVPSVPFIKVQGPNNKEIILRMSQLVPPSKTARIPRNNKQFEVESYSKLVVPVSMRSIYWQFFGFPATSEGEIISKTRIVCIICKGQIAYNRNTSNLRMHLQNKHIHELTQIESTATPRTCKSRVLRRSTKSELQNIIDDPIQDVDASGEYYSEGDTMDDAPAVYDLSEFDSQTQSFFFPGSMPAKKIKKERQKVQSIDVGSNLVNAITTYIVLDLEAPDVVNGKGFQRLLVNIENPCSVPSKPMLVDEIMPKLYNQTKEKLMNELQSFTSYMSVTLEEWTCAEGRWYASLCVYYPGNDRNINCKLLTTFSFMPEFEASHWVNLLSGVFQEWNIVSDHVTAVVCCLERDSMVDALLTMGFNPMPCLDNTIKECVRQCFSNEIITDIITKIRQQLVLLQTCPLAMKSLQEYQELHEDDTPIVLDVEAVWLSTLDMLETAVHLKDQLFRILDSVIGSPISTSLKVTDEEWDIVTDLVNVLQPLKMTLVSLSEEKVPFMSLVRPMVWQVIENKLNVLIGESETSLNLKKAIVDLLNYRYMDDRVANMLDTATIVDPRFKMLPHYTDTERAKMGEMIHHAVKDIVVHNLDEEEEVSDPKRLSNIALLLGQFQQKKVKLDSEGSTKLEYQTYLNQSTAPLDADPVQWWWRQRDKFPRLGHLADKYLCVPAVTSLPGKRTMSALLSFHNKRSTMATDLIDRFLFLHVNYGGI